VREYSAAAGVVAYPSWKLAAAIKAKRKTTPKNAQANGMFVRRDPTRNIPLTMHLWGKINKLFYLREERTRGLAYMVKLYMP
jgi:hypothetical protein